jgi:RNA-directed DNA polymerase
VTKTHIEKLQATAGLYSLSDLLGYSAKGFAYILYGISDNHKYIQFEIAKRSGGKRIINAPIPELKVLQRRLAELLEACIVDIENIRKLKNTLSHGFRPKHSIMTNASFHRKRRWVFNIDLQDFFGTINFGRICGFFAKNKYFDLDPTVARIIAQIACHERKLPQGSPCSPVIANLIAHILDVRLARLAANYGCFYTRYADDLTFSTNSEFFPEEIASRIGNSNEWTAGKKLSRIIKDCAFEINPAKTRMQFREFRQDVTGLVVNSKINVRTDYVKLARAMVDSLVKSGEFHIKKNFRDENGTFRDETKKGDPDVLRGMLAFIDSVRQFEALKIVRDIDKADYRPTRPMAKDLSSADRTLRRFLLYTQFHNPKKPLIVCEGKTDKVYIQCALRQRKDKFPELSKKEGGEAEYQLTFFNYSKVADRILHLGGGTGDTDAFIARYGKEFKGFFAPKKQLPVIVLADNDAGAKATFGIVKKAGNLSSVDGSAPYYYICRNLYIIFIPKIDGKDTTIEDLFDKSVRKIELNGKKFSGSDKFDAKTEYGKHLFAEYVVKPKQSEIDFSQFDSILSSISDVLKDFEKRQSA